MGLPLGGCINMIVTSSPFVVLYAIRNPDRLKFFEIAQSNLQLLAHKYFGKIVLTTLATSGRVIHLQRVVVRA